MCTPAQSQAENNLTYTAHKELAVAQAIKTPTPQVSSLSILRPKQSGHTNGAA